jgi:predicted transposase YdaD
VTINNKPRHDKLFRKALENPIVAHEFIEAHLPKEILQRLDTKTLTLEKESFVEPDLTNSISDVLFSCKMEAKANNGNNYYKDSYIYLLLEHVRHEVAHIKSANEIAAGWHLNPCYHYFGASLVTMVC